MPIRTCKGERGKGLTMSKAKFTPGPWRWSLYPDSGGSYLGVKLFGAGDEIVHGDGSGWGAHDPEIDVHGPDAALIAAAPELYDIACEYLDFLRSDYEGKGGKGLSGGRIAAVEAILAKARGEI